MVKTQMEISLEVRDSVGNCSKHPTEIDAPHEAAVLLDHMISLPSAKSILFGRMEKALSLLKDSLGSEFLAQFWVPEMFAGQNLLGTGGKPYLCFHHPQLQEYRQASECLWIPDPFSYSNYLPRRVFINKVPEWTSNVLYYYEKREYIRQSSAISRGIKGTIAFPVFNSDHDILCCAVLELVTMEEKPNFDYEMEKVFEALQAVNLRSNASPRLRPGCFSRDQRVVLAEIAGVVGAVCQKLKFPVALTWIPCDYNEEAVEEISKLGVRRVGGNSSLSEKFVLCVEPTSCYADEGMQGFLHACEQRHIEEGQGLAGKALQSNHPVFKENMRAYRITKYPLVHHTRKYKLNAAVAIKLRSIHTGDDDYILEFFLPLNIRSRGLIEKYCFKILPATLMGFCRSLRIVSDTVVCEQGSKVGFEEAPVQSIPPVQTALFKGDLNSIDGGISLRIPGSENVGVKLDVPQEEEARKNNGIIQSVPNDDSKMIVICDNNKRRRISEVWTWFDKIKGENGAVWAICKGCKKKYPGESKKGTSNLHKHLRSCSRKRERDAERHTPTSDLERNFVFDQERSRLNLAKMIMKLGCPLDMVQQEAFKTFVHDLQPKFQLCSLDKVKTDALLVYRQEKEKLIKHFDDHSSLFSLTIDLKSYSEKKMYCCLTLHLIDDEWELNKKILAFRNIEHDYDAGILHETIKSALVEWNIDKKVPFLVAEISPGNSQMDSELRSKLLYQFPHLKENFLCVCCYAQTLDLIARDGFYEIKDVLKKIRECIEYVNATLSKFEEAINPLKLRDKKTTSHDDPTRWDTTFVMLRSALELREALTQLEQLDCDFKVNLSAGEWNKATVVYECLKAIYKSLSSSSASIDVCFLNVCNIYKNLLLWENSQHSYVCSLAKRMKVKLDRYWNEWRLALGILLVLDPRLKLEFVQYGFEMIYGSDSSIHLHEFRKSLTQVYSKYDPGYLASSASKNSELTSYDPDSDDPLRGFCEWRKQKHDCNVVDSQKSDLHRYLEEPLQKKEKVSDILAWWRANASIFPTLGKMARDFLSIPISAILSKPTLGDEAAKMNPAFSGLGPDIIEALICGQDWLGFSEKKSEEGRLAVFPASDSNVRCNSPNLPVPKYLAGPFWVSKPVSREYLKLIQYSFDPLLDESETIVRCEHYHLSRREFCSLRPQNCLDDLVISMMSDVLTLVERQKEVSVNWYLPIDFAKSADDPSGCIAFAKDKKIRENYMSDLFCCEKMFVPVFDNVRSHFYLYILYLKKQVVEIWDSLAESSDREVVFHRLRNLLVSLDILFKDDIDQNYPAGWSFANFGVERPMNIPQQPNGYDCGVYVIKFMLAPEEVKHHDFVFDSDEERLNVVLRLLDRDVNLCRSNLTAKAETYYQRNSETNDSLSFAPWQEMKT